VVTTLHTSAKYSVRELIDYTTYFDILLYFSYIKIVNFAESLFLPSVVLMSDLLWTESKDWNMRRIQSTNIIYWHRRRQN